jgi:hypothetical protein
MKLIPMSLDQVEVWSSIYDGSREGIFYDATNLNVPDEVFDEISALDLAPLPTAKERKIAELTQSCEADIVGGYSSSALGASHTYPSTMTDQINMMGSVTASLLPDLGSGWSTPFWCADSSDEWSFQPHSVVQIRQAGSDGKAHIVNCQGKLQQLSAAVFAATTPDEVAAVVWDAP